MWTRIVWATLCATGIYLAAAATAVAQKPAGIGPNLHRSHMIRRAQQRAAQGRPVTKHVGIWVAGGYKSTVFGSGNPYLNNRGIRPAPRSNYQSGPYAYSPPAPPVLGKTLWDRFPDAADYKNPFVRNNAADRVPLWISSLQTTGPLTEPSLDDARNRQLQDRVAAAETAFRTAHINEMLDGLHNLSQEFSHSSETYQLAALERFQTQDYSLAAALAHTALSGGRYWNWRRLRMLYDTREAYTAQLRELEQTVAEYPNQSELRFLLGFHYLMLGHDAAALVQFRHVSQSIPQDKLTALVVEKLSHAAP